MFCKICQTHLPQDALSCSTCGTPVTEEERQQATGSDTILRPTTTELQTVQNLPSADETAHEAAATDVQGAPSDDAANHKHETTATDAQILPSDDADHKAAAESRTIQDISPFQGEQPFSEYAFVQEPLSAAIPVTQTDIPVPQIVQVETRTPAYLPPASMSQAPTPHKQRQTSLVLLTLALIGLGLLLLIENGGVIFFVVAYQPAQVHAQATAQAHKLATAQVQATSISQLQATAQTQDSSENLKMSLAQAQTGDPRALYTMATSRKPTLDASTPTKSNNVCNDFNGGAFHVLESEQSRFSTCYSTSGGDFVFQIQMNINTGDDGGLFFRGSGNDDFGYLLQLNPSGYYDAFSRNSNPNKWLQGGSMPGFKTGYNQTNLITIIALGDNFYLYSNTQYIGHIKDNAYSSGSIELVAANIQATDTDVVYSGAEFWDLS